MALKNLIDAFKLMTREAENELGSVSPQFLDPVQRRILQTWNRVGGGEKVFDLNKRRSRESILRISRTLYHVDSFARNIILIYTYLTIGDGIKVDFIEDDGPAKIAKKRWKIFTERNEFLDEQVNIVRCMFLLGNWFSVLFPLNEFGESTQKTDIRGLEPLEIQSIQTLKGDVRSVVSYTTDFGEFASEDITHFHVHRVGNTLWGASVLEPLIDDLKRYQGYLQARYFLNKIRASIPLIHIIKGTTPDRIASEATKFASQPKPATVIHASDRESWEFPDLNIKAGGAEDDGRRILLSAAAGSGLPEHAVTGDFSKAAYSSTLVAEAPMTKMFLFFQEKLRMKFTKIIHQVIGNNARFSVQFPPVLRRKWADDIPNLMQLHGSGVISSETLLNKLGIDPETEKRKVDNEKKENPNMMIPSTMRKEIIASIIEELINKETS